MKDRRETLKIVGAIGSTCAFPFAANELYGQQVQEHTHAAALQSAAAPLPKAPVFFTPAEFAVVTRMADLIIPATNTPGAVAAGVPLYIDMVVSRNPQAQKLYRAGIQWLDKDCRARRGGKTFIELDEAEQIAVLTPLCAAADAETEAPAGSGRAGQRRSRPPGVALFKTVKSMTADGFYTSKEGLIDELGYRGNTVMAEFPVCTHEH